MAELGRAIERAEEVLNRVRSESTGIAARARRRRWAALVRRVKLAVLAMLGVMVAAAVTGMFVPIGIGGFFLAMVAMMVVALTILLWPAAAEATPQALVQTDLKQLPQRTEEWLERQRPALPAPAIRLVDGIGARLDALGPQLATLDPAVPAAAELRKLMAEELPELVSGYQRVPAHLRRDESRGLSPDRQLVEGLTVVDSELARMAEQLARGDLDRLATQNRYLELKYRGAEDAG
ncbi:hypothetical protein [Sphingomonas profundi]|uniref:hypothetical protein n=1 Tax=Alterirhizorhabdus profundi TaxID=2681549 RepID=UPI0012E8A53D|nr:hypothetical protein [Sphingomonas profundi]